MNAHSKQLITVRYHFGEIISLSLLGVPFFLFVIAGFALILDDPGAAVLGWVIAGLFLWPMIRIIRRHRSRLLAARLANYFDGVSQASVSIEQLGNKMNIQKPLKTLEKLIQGNYLCNVRIDYEDGSLILLGAPPQPQTVIAVECPNCGAKSMLNEGDPSCCPYCNGKVMPHVEKKKG